MRDKELLERLLSGKSDNSIRFTDLTRLLEKLGFQSRVRGSHHIFFRPEVPEILNLQPRGSMAKPYQAKQVRDVILRYKLEV